jgi:hypothetical protein
MSKSMEEMALRKKVLLAKSTLHRLEMQRNAQGIADSLGWVRTGAKAVSSLSVRAGLLGLALRRVTGSPVGQAVALTSGLILLSKVASLGLQLIRSSGARSPEQGTP